LKEQLIHQMMTLEEYLRVAQLWYVEKEEDYNPYNETNVGFNESFVSLPQAAGTVSDDGWVDYPAHDNVNTIPQKVDEVEFDINEFNRSLIGNAILAESSKSPFVKKQKSNFVVPKQIKSLNTKIRNLFFR